MSIIFKILKYLKNYSNLIKNVLIIALAFMLVINTICFYNCRSSYKEEVSVLQTELDSLSTKNEELETKGAALDAQRNNRETFREIYTTVANMIIKLLQ